VNQITWYENYKGGSIILMVIFAALVLNTDRTSPAPLNWMLDFAFSHHTPPYHNATIPNTSNENQAANVFRLSLFFSPISLRSMAGRVLRYPPLYLQQSVQLQPVPILGTILSRLSHN
jgi:hypothetical protein